MQTRAIILAAGLLTLLPMEVQAQALGNYAALQQADDRLARVAERLQVANAHLCRQLMPVTGLILHSADQYRSPPAGWFGQAPVAVWHIVPGSPADNAGLEMHDGVVAIGNQALAGWPDEQGRPRRDAVFALLAAQDPSQPVSLTIRRAGEELTVALNSVAGCRALVEVLASGPDTTARADGRVIQVSRAMVERYSDAELAVIVAHELAHAALEHRRRLAEAGVQQGLARELGRSRRLSRQAEREADLLSVHLLANAGFDPQSAPRFWLSEAGESLSHGIFNSRVYPSRRERAAAMQAEIETYLAGLALPSSAGHLVATRDRPFEE